MIGLRCLQGVSGYVPPCRETQSCMVIFQYISSVKIKYPSYSSIPCPPPPPWEYFSVCLCLFFLKLLPCQRIQDFTLIVLKKEMHCFHQNFELNNAHKVNQIIKCLFVAYSFLQLYIIKNAGKSCNLLRLILVIYCRVMYANFCTKNKYATYLSYWGPSKIIDPKKKFENVILGLIFSIWLSDT